MTSQSLHSIHYWVSRTAQLFLIVVLYESSKLRANANHQDFLACCPSLIDCGESASGAMLCLILGTAVISHGDILIRPVLLFKLLLLVCSWGTCLGAILCTFAVYSERRGWGYILIRTSGRTRRCTCWDSGIRSRRCRCFLRPLLPGWLFMRLDPLSERKMGQKISLLVVQLAVENRSLLIRCLCAPFGGRSLRLVSNAQSGDAR
jgi:hypothetical protein